MLNLEGIEFPVTLKQITKFELLNDISVNVFIERERGGKKDDGNIIVPLRLTKEKKKEKHVNLLYLQESRRDDENVIGHFTWIKNLSRLIGSQLSKNTREYKGRSICAIGGYTMFSYIYEISIQKLSRILCFFKNYLFIHEYLFCPLQSNPHQILYTCANVFSNPRSTSKNHFL